MRIRVEVRMNKLCPKCKTEKPVSEFTKNRGTKDGHHALCRICKRASMKLYMESPRGKATFRKNHLRRTYGLTPDQYESLLTTQGGKCAICKIDNNPARRASVFTVDHCHKTGTVRGLLCTQCNALLGLAKERTEILDSASLYLRNYAEQP